MPKPGLLLWNKVTMPATSMTWIIFQTSCQVTPSRTKIGTIQDALAMLELISKSPVSACDLIWRGGGERAYLARKNSSASPRSTHSKRLPVPWVVVRPPSLSRVHSVSMMPRPWISS